MELDEPTSMIIIALVAGPVGALGGCIAGGRKAALLPALLIAWISASALLGLAFFTWLTVTGSANGVPNGHHPIVVAMAATLMCGIGILVFSIIPSFIGFLITYYLCVWFKRPKAGASLESDA
jgi:hypothetical protein